MVFSSCCRDEKTIVAFSDYDFLKTGDIVCRLGNGYFSNIFRQYASNDKAYSHIGIVSVEDDSVFVFHSEASELTGVGSVRKDPLSVFLEGIDKYCFFQLEADSLVKNKMMQTAQHHFNVKTKFDLHFNSSDDREMYCTEFVAKCINTGFDDEIIKPTINLNGFLLYGLDDIYNSEVVSRIDF